MPQNWHDSFRAKTIVEDDAVAEFVDVHIEKNMRVEEIIDSLRWRLSRRFRNKMERDHDEKDHIPTLKNTHNDTIYYLAKMEINLLSYTYIVCLFTETDDEVCLINVMFSSLDTENTENLL